MASIVGASAGVSVPFHVNPLPPGPMGTPGADTFSIVMSDSYSASGTLGGGNVQIHK